MSSSSSSQSPQLQTVELGEPLPKSSRPLVFHSVVHFDTAVLLYIQDQLEEINEDVGSLRLRQITFEQRVKLQDTNDEVESLRKTISEQQGQLEEMTERIRNLTQTTSEQ